jgi:hypothetical protein
MLGTMARQGEYSDCARVAALDPATGTPPGVAEARTTAFSHSTMARITTSPLSRAHRDVEGDLDVGGGGLPGEADGVVEENLMGSGLDHQRGQAGQAGEYGTDQAGRGVLSCGVVGDPGLQVFSAEQRIDCAGSRRSRRRSAGHPAPAGGCAVDRTCRGRGVAWRRNPFG